MRYNIKLHAEGVVLAATVGEVRFERFLRLGTC